MRTWSWPLALLLAHGIWLLALPESWAVRQLEAYCLLIWPRPWTYEILTNGFIWPARRRTADEPGQDTSSVRKTETLLRKYLPSRRFTEGERRVEVHILFMFTYRRNQFRYEEKSFYAAAFARWKSIFKLFAIIPPRVSRLYPWAHLFAIIRAVRDPGIWQPIPHRIAIEFWIDRVWMKFENKNDSIWIINCAIYAHFPALVRLLG